MTCSHLHSDRALLSFSREIVLESLIFDARARYEESEYRFASATKKNQYRWKIFPRLTRRARFSNKQKETFQVGTTFRCIHSSFEIGVEVHNYLFLDTEM
jgi:hypothetical protein